MSDSAHTNAPQAIAIPGASPEEAASPQSLSPSQQQSAARAATTIFDQLVAKSAEKDAQASMSPGGISHPAIFRKGTLIEIPDTPPKSPMRRRSRASKAALPQRFVAIAIKDDAQAEHVIRWALQKELVPERDSIALIHVRPAANGIIGDLTSANSTKEDAERDRSHELLRKHAAAIKREGYRIKGVSIRGVDIRGELVRKLVELRCDLLIVGSHASKSMKERLIGSKVEYLTSNSPCPVLVVGRNAQCGSKEGEASGAGGGGGGGAAQTPA